MDEQKQQTRDFFHSVASRWENAVYDVDQTFLRFPTGKVRTEIAIREIVAAREEGAGNEDAIDLGCGTGQLVFEMREAGLNACGVDIAPAMIEEAQKTLKELEPNVDASEAFKLVDIEEWWDPDQAGQYEYVTAMGLIEYLEEDAKLLETASHLLQPGGVLFIQCRNRLFNLTSSNDYTRREATTGQIQDLLYELNESPSFSPATTEEAINDAAKELIGSLALFSSMKLRENREFDDVISSRPAQIVRRQHTPTQIATSTENAGLRLKHIIYYHVHPYPPRYQKLFPDLYNRLSLAMQPLGYTSAAAPISSSFVACIEKPIQ